MSKVKFTKADVGCWVDDARGRYMGERIQEIAASYGWTSEKLDFDHELYYEAWDEAVDYLQSLCDETVYFTSEHGPFCLVEATDDDE
jgi:hypothetical protein